MIKWILTTLILVVVVAVLTVILQTPSLRNKSGKWLSEKTALAQKRAGELKGIIESKTGAKPAGSDLPKTKTGTKPGPGVKEISGSTAQPIKEEVPESDRKKLEEVLEKANRPSKPK